MACLRPWGLTGLKYFASIHAVEAECPAALVEAVASLDEVWYVELKRPAESHLDTSVGLSDATRVRDDTVYRFGTNITVGIMDSGFNVTHDAFLAQGGYPSLCYTGLECFRRWREPDQPGRGRVAARHPPPEHHVEPMVVEVAAGRLSVAGRKR